MSRLKVGDARGCSARSGAHTHTHTLRYRALFFAGPPAAAERRNLFHCTKETAR